MLTQHNYWHPKHCFEEKALPNVMVIFGASGDLTKRKLLPALFSLAERNLLHKDFRILGCARTKMTTEEYRIQVKEFLDCDDQKKIENFLSLITYVSGDYSKQGTYEKIQQQLDILEKDFTEPANRIFYLAVPASLYSLIIPILAKNGLTEENYQREPWRSVVLEKPFGFDLQSAEELDKMLHKHLKEGQIYRIDHYLGKETVQNILMLRFANIIFEPIWNSNYIDHIQITAAESLGVEQRAGYYDDAGQLRDMFQNHLLAMLSLVAMEMPAVFDADALRDEQLKLMRSIRAFEIDKLHEQLVRAQYIEGEVTSANVAAYRDENGVKENSTTETYMAAKLFIDNWRWRGVPFYLRTGKRLANKLSEIAITFKKVPHSIFPQLPSEALEADTLILNVQPEEGMALSIQAKKPGAKLCLGTMTLNFSYEEIFAGKVPDAYERLLLDCMIGDQTLFIRSDIIAAAWKLLTPILQAWEKSDKENMPCPCQLYKYKAGSQGPKEAEKIFENENTKWRNI